MKIISGGQVGADQGGLAAAVDLKIPTGGWAPRGFWTLNGENKNLEKLGLKDCGCLYPIRTAKNVQDSDGTIRFAYDFKSPGEICTLNALNKYQKPYFDINLNSLPFVFDVHDWLKKEKINILNIAGNAGKNRKQQIEIFNKVRKYLKRILETYE